MMEARNNSSNKTNSPNKTNIPNKSPNGKSSGPAFHSPNKESRKVSIRSSGSNSISFSNIMMIIVGVFAGVIFAKPFLMLGGISGKTDSLQSYMVLLQASFDPPVQTVTSSSSSLSVGTRGAEAKATDAAEATTVANPSESQSQAAQPQTAATNANTNTNTNTNMSSMDINTSSSTGVIARDFEAQPRVVIATKIHGPPHIPQLKQSLCLLMAAYNNHRNLHYDIVVFTTLPVSQIDEADLQEIVNPAHLTIETDKLTLNQHIDGLNPEQKRNLYERCNRTYDDPLYWGTRSCEDGGECASLAYNWQAEFRAKHIWKHDALAKYKYMLWYDSDSMSTRVWEQDPIAVMIRNNLAMFFDNFPQGRTKGQEVQAKIKEAYNDTLCSLRMQNGHLVKSDGGSCPAVPQMHGFFHITNLDFYRSPENMRWYDILIGDNKFSRKWDDQLSVTVPAAMRAGNRSWEMGANGVNLDVWHNGFLDGKRKWKGGGYLKWWKKEAEVSFPEGFGSCKSLVTNPGR
jgi:hypothetical protein